jgi:hypothetical protein
VNPLRHILTALHSALGRYLDQPKPKAKAKRKARPKAAGRGKLLTAVSSFHPRTSEKADESLVERRRVCWFDLEPGTLALPKSEEEQETEAWYRAHFKINGQPLP